MDLQLGLSFKKSRMHTVSLSNLLFLIIQKNKPEEHVCDFSERSFFLNGKIYRLLHLRLKVKCKCVIATQKLVCSFEDTDKSK